MADAVTAGVPVRNPIVTRRRGVSTKMFPQSSRPASIPTVPRCPSSSSPWPRRGRSSPPARGPNPLRVPSHRRGSFPSSSGLRGRAAFISPSVAPTTTRARARAVARSELSRRRAKWKWEGPFRDVAIDVVNGPFRWVPLRHAPFRKKNPQNRFTRSCGLFGFVSLLLGSDCSDLLTPFVKRGLWVQIPFPAPYPPGAQRLTRAVVRDRFQTSKRAVRRAVNHRTFHLLSKPNQGRPPCSDSSRRPHSWTRTTPCSESPRSGPRPACARTASS